MNTIRRRLQFQGVDDSGASRFTIYSLTREGKEVQHQVTVHFENGEFHCTCEDHTYRQTVCKHIRRAEQFEMRRRREVRDTTPSVWVVTIPPVREIPPDVRRGFGAPAPINYDRCLED